MKRELLKYIRTLPPDEQHQLALDLLKVVVSILKAGARASGKTLRFRPPDDQLNLWN